jgi:putative endonuclease
LILIELRVFCFTNIFQNLKWPTFYILFSKSIDRYYVGSCLDLEKRISEHNSGKHTRSFTKRANDWEKYFIIENLEYQMSRKIESYVKSLKSRKYIENLKQYEELQLSIIKRFDSAGSSR